MVHHELGLDNTILQVTSGLMEHGVYGQMREALLEIVVPPYLGLPIDEVQVDTVVARKSAVFIGGSPLQEYIDNACNMGYPTIGREAWIPRHIWLIGWVELHELSMVQHSGLMPYTCAHISNPSQRMD